MSSPKLIAYKAIVEMTSMMAEFMKNPAVIAQYGQEAAQAVAMTDAEIAKRDEALVIIENAKQETESLNSFREECKKQQEAIAKRSAELENIRIETEQKVKHSDTKYQDSLRIMKDAELKNSKAQSMQDDMLVREGQHQENIEKLNNDKVEFEKKLNDKQEKLNEREKLVTAREAKIKQILGAAG